MTTTIRGYPATSDRCRGWLRYLFRKATTADNWDQHGQPHEHWDAITGEPMQTPPTHHLRQCVINSTVFSGPFWDSSIVY